MYINRTDLFFWDNLLMDEDWKQLAEEKEKGIPQDISLFYELVQIDGGEQVQFR